MASITKDTDEKSPVAYESVEETTKDEAPIAAMEELGQGGFDEKATKRLLRKIDWNLLPLITVLYLCAPSSPPISLSGLTPCPQIH